MPAAVGVKVTLIVQLLPAAKPAGQLLVAAKSPEAAMLVMSKAALPTLLSVTVCTALVVPTGREVAKVKLRGAKVTLGLVMPLPLSVIVCGLLPALSVRVMEPTALPVVVGVKVTLMVQIPPVATDEPQVLVCAKGAVAVIEPRLRVAVPLFVTVTVCTALVVFTA